MRGIIFNRAARLVGEFAEVNFERVARSAEHVDIGAGAEDARLKAGDDDGLHLGMLKAQSLNRVCELDIHAQIIGIELEFVAFGHRLIFRDIHGKGSHLAVDIEFPMAVPLRCRLKINHQNLSLVEFWPARSNVRSTRHNRRLTEKRSTRREVWQCPYLECADLSALSSLRPVAASCRKGHITKQRGVKPPRAKAMTGHRTPN